MNGGTASAPSTAVVAVEDIPTTEPEDSPATEPTSAESRTRSRVGGSSSSSPAVTAAQMEPIASSASSISWLLDRSRGMASVRSANVLAPNASQVY